MKNNCIQHALFGLSMLVSMDAWSMICSTDPDTLIPDDSTNTTASDANPGTEGSITIDVPAGFAGTITDLDFQLLIDIDFPGDLIVTLTSPSNTTVTLINRPGRADDGSGTGGFGCGVGLGGGPDIDVTLDDSATTAAENVCNTTSPAISGTVSPTGNLSDFNGETLSGTWTLTAVDLFPLDQGTFISSQTCLSFTTSPVTVSSVRTRQRGEKIIFDWQTASEAFNLGFHLWGNIEGEWQQLNNRLVPAKSGDSLTPVDYRRRVKLSDLPGEVTQVGLSALSTVGQEDFYGPFDIGESYGEQAVPKKINWLEERAANDAARRAAGYTKINNRWVENTDRRAKRSSRLEQRFDDVVLSIKKDGVYRVSYEALLAKGLDLKGMPINRLSLTRNSQAVPRIVTTKGGAKRFGEGGEIIFYAQGPDQKSIRYVDDARYLISLDPSKVLKANRLEADVKADVGATQTSHKSVITFGEKNTHLFFLTGEEPWFDTSVRAFGQTANHEITIAVPESADLSQPASLALSLVGGIEFALLDADGDGELEPNHHYKIFLNRDRFEDPITEGFSNGLDAIDIDVDVTSHLTHGENVVEIELIPDNGYNIDIVYYLGGALSYTEPSVFAGDALSYLAETGKTVLQVADPDKKMTGAYSVDSDGNFSQLKIKTVGEDRLLMSPFNPALDDDANPGVWLVSEASYSTVSDAFAAQVVSDDDLSLSGVDYAVIADPSLIGEDLQRFVDQQKTLGRNAKVINVDDVFHRYNDGQVLPQAIASYLKDQSSISDFKYVLLVGGHTYNYRGYNVESDLRPINMIPSFYREADYLSKQIPTAVPFVDFDADGIPDRAIGRWPVRNIEQLKNVVDKTLDWHAQGSHKNSKTSLFIADAQDSYNNFSLSADRLSKQLGSDGYPWPEPTKVYSDVILQDDSIVSGERLAFNRESLIDGINQGPALTVFTGHGAPVSWGAQRLLNASTVDGFENEGAPSLIVPLACYTTYYETPEVKSLSELLLTDSNRGAVALSGAALLSATLDNENFTRRLLQQMTIEGVDLGTAVLRTKQSMKGSGGGRSGLIYNWVTLGDPTLSFGLPNIAPPPKVEPQPTSRR